MADFQAFDDPGPSTPVPPSRLRRALTTTIVLLLVASMVFLAWLSGRGEIVVTPVTTPTAEPEPAVAVGAGRLAIVDAAGRLVTTDATGGSVVTYGRAGVSYAFPAWSPDGSRIAAVGTDADGAAIHVFTTTDSAGAASAVPRDPVVVYRAVDRPPFYLYWAPDGRRLTFLTTEPNGLALRIAPADDSAPSTILREGSPMYWAWTGDDRLLLHGGGDAPDAFLGEIGGDGSGVERIDVVPGAFRAPALSRDGRYRAYVVPGQDEGFAPPGPVASQRVVLETGDGTVRHQLDVLGAVALGFGARTDDLALISSAKAGPEGPLPIGPLRVVDGSSGEVRSLLAGAVVAFFWSPDGRTIAALQLVAPGDDKIALASDVVPSATASGTELRLVFVDAGSGTIRSQSVVKLGDLFVAQLLPYFDQYALSHRLWTPDSASIVLPLIDDDGATALVTLRADGSDRRRVVDGSIGFWSPSR